MVNKITDRILPENKEKWGKAYPIPVEKAGTPYFIQRMSRPYSIDNSRLIHISFRSGKIFHRHKIFYSLGDTGRGRKQLTSKPVGFVWKYLLEKLSKLLKPKIAIIIRIDFRIIAGFSEITFNIIYAY